MTIHAVFEDLQARARAPAEECGCLDETSLWSIDSPLVWKAKAAGGRSSFYPVYRHGDLYSWSLLALILRKGHLSINRSALTRANSPGFQYLGGNDTLDTTIQRVGGPPRSRPCIHDAENYAHRLAEALAADTSVVETRSDGAVNAILCGGKDSLNLLLLPWRNPVVAISASPNYPLVRRFVEQNQLGIEVIHLEDREDPDVHEQEVLIGLARADLSQWRWGVHLKELASNLGPRVIFWKGQLADVYTTSKWMDYANSARWSHLRKSFKHFGHLLPEPIRVGAGRRLQRSVFEAIWTRGAAMQGIHMEFLRQLTGCLFLSAYHGPCVSRVWEQADLPRAAASDIRGRIGKLLCGRDVQYPQSNPGPLPSAFRRDLGRPYRLLALLDKLGFPNFSAREQDSPPRYTVLAPSSPS